MSGSDPTVWTGRARTRGARPRAPPLRAPRSPTRAASSTAATRSARGPTWTRRSPRAVEREAGSVVARLQLREAHPEVRHEPAPLGRERGELPLRAEVRELGDRGGEQEARAVAAPF